MSIEKFLDDPMTKPQGGEAAARAQAFTMTRSLCESIGIILVSVSCAWAQKSTDCDASMKKYVDLESQAITKVAAEYPAEPGLRVTGRVVVRVVVDKKGEVVSARVVCGHPLLVPASMKAVAQWKFQPKRFKGKAVRNAGIVVFDFT